MTILRKTANGWWQFEGNQAATDLNHYRVVSLGEWLENSDLLLASKKSLALRLAPTDALRVVGRELKHFAIILIEFPTFADGRGCSQAHLLRQRWGYTGELRAFGDIRRDELDFLARCGFDTLKLPPGTNLAEAQAASAEIVIDYQPGYEARARAGT